MADGEIASIPATDATTIALGLMVTLNSTAFTLNCNATLPEKRLWKLSDGRVGGLVL